QRCYLVRSVMKDQAIRRKRLDEFSEPEEGLVLLLLVIRPERMVDGGPSGFDQCPDEVVEVSVGNALNVQVDPSCGSRERRGAVDVNNAGSDRASLQGVVVWVFMNLCPLARLTVSECVRYLRYGEEPLPIVRIYFLFSHPQEKAQVVFLHGLLVAP